MTGSIYLGASGLDRFEVASHLASHIISSHYTMNYTLYLVYFLISLALCEIPLIHAIAWIVTPG
jgi:hypothetical protein